MCRGTCLSCRKLLLCKNCVWTAITCFAREPAVCLRGSRPRNSPDGGCSYYVLNRWCAAGGASTCLVGNFGLHSLLPAPPAQRCARPCPCRRESVKGCAGVCIFLAGNFCCVEIVCAVGSFVSRAKLVACLRGLRACNSAAYFAGILLDCSSMQARIRKRVCRYACSSHRKLLSCKKLYAPPPPLFFFLHGHPRVICAS